MMERWENQILSWYLYFVMMILLSLALLSQLYHHLTIWMLVWIIVSIIPIFIFLKEPYRGNVKSWMDKMGIRLVHLWVGLTVAYYLIIGLLKILGGIA